MERSIATPGLGQWCSRSGPSVKPDKYAQVLSSVKPDKYAQVLSSVKPDKYAQVLSSVKPDKCLIKACELQLLPTSLVHKPSFPPDAHNQICAPPRVCHHDPPPFRGRFGPYGGRFVGESLIQALIDLERSSAALLQDPAFLFELSFLLRDYSGRPTPLCLAPNLSRHYGRGLQIFLKREDLNHTSSHCINAALGHALLARRLGKRRLLAVTGSGHHAAAVAAAAARMGMEAVVFVAGRDVTTHIQAQAALRGCRVVEVSGRGAAVAASLKDAVAEAMREMLSDGGEGDAYLVPHSAVGPHPMPWIAREMQRLVGEEAREAWLARFGILPDAVVACVGGGASSLGLFYPFLSDTTVRLIGIQAGGPNNDHLASPIIKGDVGVFHGAMSYLLQDTNGQTLDIYSIAPGLNYPCVGPEHSFLKDTKRVEYHCIIDEHALCAFHKLIQLEGIIPALETSHALAYLDILCPKLDFNSKIIVNCSGSSDAISFM